MDSGETINREMMDGHDDEYVFAGQTLGSAWVFPEHGIARVQNIRFTEAREQGVKTCYPTVEFSGSAPNLRVQSFRRRISEREEDVGDLEASNPLAEQIHELVNRGNTSSEMEPPQTEYEELLHRMGRIRAFIKRLQVKLGDEDISGEFAVQMGVLSGDFNTLTEEVIEYIEGDGEMPDTCPVCGDEVKPVDELEAGKSYDIDRMCIEETTPSGAGNGFIHFTEQTDDRIQKGENTR